MGQVHREFVCTHVHVHVRKYVHTKYVKYIHACNEYIKWDDVFLVLEIYVWRWTYTEYTIDYMYVCSSVCCMYMYISLLQISQEWILWELGRKRSLDSIRHSCGLNQQSKSEAGELAGGGENNFIKYARPDFLFSKNSGLNLPASGMDQHHRPFSVSLELSYGKCFLEVMGALPPRHLGM